MLALGVAATLAANADFGAAHGAAGIVLSAWPAIAFVGSAEVAFGMVRRSAATATVADSVRDPRSVASLAIEADSIPVMGATAKPVIFPAAAAVESATSRPPVRPAAKPAKARRAAAIVRANPDVSGAELGRRLGVSERQGRRLLAQVASSG